MSELHHIFRRVVHSMAWIYLVYYLMPKTIIGYSRSTLFLIVVFIILAFESIRVWQRWHIFGLRDYERTKIAAYAWATMGAAIALLLFPMHLAVLALIGMGAVDPLCGEVRYHFPKMYPWIPLVAYFLLSVVILNLLTGHSLIILITLGFFGSISAIISEYPKIIFDDDFLMVVVPLMVLRIVEYLLI